MGEMEKERLERMEDAVKELPKEKREAAIDRMMIFGQGFAFGMMFREKQAESEAGR